MTASKNKTKSSLSIVKSHLRGLSYSELEDVIAWAERFRNEKVGVEELRLLKEKEKVEQKLKNLKDMDYTQNML